MSNTNTWAVIAVSDLQAYLIDVQYRAIATGGLATGQADPFSVVMVDVTNTIRNIIAKKGKPVSLTANSVPQEARTHTVWLILQALQSRIPGLLLVGEQRRNVEKAEAFLKELAEPGFAVSVPTDPVYPQVNIGTGISVVTPGARHGMNLRRLDGFM